MAPAIAAVKVPSPFRAGTGNAARFPRPRGTVPCRSARPGITKGQRPTRRAGSARRGRVGRWPGAVAPGWTRASAALWQGRWPLPKGPVIPECTGAPPRTGAGNATRVSPARAARCPVDRQVQAPRKASARRGRAGRRAGAIAPARPREARSEEGPAIRPTADAAGTFSAACQAPSNSAVPSPPAAAIAARPVPLRRS